jgi:hypothetical protein
MSSQLRSLTLDQMTQKPDNTYTPLLIKREENAVSNRSPSVEAFLANLDHPFKAEVLRLRDIILDSDDAITEQVKWNAPSFCYAGDDRITFRLHPPKAAQLIFHRGTKKNNSKLDFEDSSDLLTWLAPDRATLVFRSIDEVSAHEQALMQLVREWMAATTG